jgi:hypothetical protein
VGSALGGHVLHDRPQAEALVLAAAQGGDASIT